MRGRNRRVRIFDEGDGGDSVKNNGRFPSTIGAVDGFIGGSILRALMILWRRFVLHVRFGLTCGFLALIAMSAAAFPPHQFPNQRINQQAAFAARLRSGCPRTTSAALVERARRPAGRIVAAGQGVEFWFGQGPRRQRDR